MCCGQLKVEIAPFSKISKWLGFEKTMTTEAKNLRESLLFKLKGGGASTKQNYLLVEMEKYVLWPFVHTQFYI